MIHFVLYLSVSASLSLGCFGQLSCHADRRIVNIMKVYIERNNVQVELIRFRNKYRLYSRLLCEATVSMQYRPPNANQEVSNTNHFGSIYDSLGRLAASLSLLRFGLPITLLRFVDKRIVNIMKVYIGRNNNAVKNVYFIQVYFCEATNSMQYPPANTNQALSNTNHFGSVSDCLGQLAAVSQCIATYTKLYKENKLIMISAKCLSPMI